MVSSAPTSTPLATPDTGRAGAEAFVAAHLSHLICDEPIGSGSFVGGQKAADSALESFDVATYAQRRNEVFPMPKRGASAISPYVRHGYLSLEQVWNHVGGGPARDVDKFRDELLWQEFARHWYARLGSRTRTGVRRQLLPTEEAVEAGPPSLDSWDRELACFELTIDELEEDGWAVNQSRMWLASHWAVRAGNAWQDGEDLFFRHLVDGSRAANRLGWQWTVGVGSSKAYGFSRWQVEKRAPGLCASCDFVHACPVENWPADPPLDRIEPPALLKLDSDPSTTGGPVDVDRSGEQPDVVWLTAESLGDGDPALAANPDLPALFVFDEALLAKLQLSGKRLVFLVEGLAELATRRPVELVLGDPVAELAGRRPAVTFAPVPGFRRRVAQVDAAEVHPWPWLVRPGKGSIASYSAWRRAVGI